MASASWAIFRSTSLTTVLMCGHIRNCFGWMTKGGPPLLREFHPITSARPVNFGVTLFIAGMPLLLPVTVGGLIVAVRLLECLIWSGWTTFAVSKVTGKFQR